MPLSRLLSRDRLAALPAIAASICVGAAGGLGAQMLGAPLPWLLGSLIAVAAITLAGVRIGGRAPGVPSDTRLYFIPIIGVAIGGAFTPAILAEATDWIPSLLALVIYIPIAHAAGFAIYRKIGGLDAPTAYYASVPGGLIESIAMGEDAGADLKMLALLQFLRLILCILLVPLGFTAFTGAAVGSAAGVAMPGAGGHPGVIDYAVLVVAGVVGSIGGRRIGLPAGIITGPILLSGGAHLAGLTHAIPPGWLILVTQLMVGVSLGSRFAGLTGKDFTRGVALALGAIAATLSLALIAALLLRDAVGERPEAVILAFAPGGVAEMSLIAVSMQISVVYVTAHHVARILLSVMVAKAFAGLAGAGARKRR